MQTRALSNGAAAVLQRTVTQWTPGIKPTWTVAEVRTALRLHADGNFSQSAQLVDTMGEDDEIPGALEKYVDSVLGSDFRLDPVDHPNKQLSERLARQYQACWFEIFPESEIDQLLRWWRMLGVAIGCLDWHRAGSKWVATLRVLHPQFLRWDEFRKTYIYSAQEGELEVTPGDGRWILLVDGTRGWMRAGVRALAITWIGKQLAMRDWNRYNERHGLPIIKAFAPAIADDTDQDQFWEDVRGIQSETVAQLPTHLEDGPNAKDAKFDLDLLEAKDGSWETFPKLLERADRKFQVYILGANISSEVVKEGSRATADVHRGVERAKATAGAKKLSTSLRAQALFPIIAINVAAVVVIDVVPWPYWDTLPTEDDKAEAETVAAFGKALVEIGKAGYEVEPESLAQLAERYGVKLIKRVPQPLPSVTMKTGSDSAAQPDDQDAAVAAE